MAHSLNLAATARVSAVDDGLGVRLPTRALRVSVAAGVSARTSMYCRLRSLPRERNDAKYTKAAARIDLRPGSGPTTQLNLRSVSYGPVYLLVLA